jgi:20S proteasome alpha/beta subunit
MSHCYQCPWTMVFFPNRKYLLIVLLQLWLSVHLTLSSSISGSKDLLTPIPRWQESWTASQAHGTAMAMVVQDCLILFLRSPSTDVYKPTFSNPDVIDFNGLRVERIGGEHQHASMQYAPSWFPIGSHGICAMTGLALDVEHICRVLQKKVDDYFFVYQTSMTTHAMTQKVASVLQNECLLKGSRPYGVQCMFVGCDDIDPRDGGLCIYSIDPTGTWQSWGRATAIGKFGQDVRRILAKKLQSSPSITELDTAVECLLGSWKETCKDLGIDKNDEEVCEVLILQKDQKNSRKSCLFRVSTEEVDRIMDKVDSTISAN